MTEGITAGHKNRAPRMQNRWDGRRSSRGGWLGEATPTNLAPWRGRERASGATPPGKAVVGARQAIGDGGGGGGEEGNPERRLEGRQGMGPTTWAGRPITKRHDGEGRREGEVCQCSSGRTPPGGG